eukprot:SAG31_NODE_1992_length_6709_cov_3.654870_1_plen_376_part_00
MSDWADFGEPAPALQKMPVGASSAAAGAGRFAPTCCPSALSGGCAEVRQFLQVRRFPAEVLLLAAARAAIPSQSIPINPNHSQSIPIDPINHSQSIPINPNQSQSTAINPNQSQPIPINPNQSQLIPIIPNQSQSIPSNPNQSQSIPTNPNQSQPIPTNPNQSQSIPINLNQSQPIPIIPEPAARCRRTSARAPRPWRMLRPPLRTRSDCGAGASRGPASRPFSAAPRCCSRSRLPVRCPGRQSGTPTPLDFSIPLVSPVLKFGAAQATVGCRAAPHRRHRRSPRRAALRWRGWCHQNPSQTQRRFRCCGPWLRKSRSRLARTRFGCTLGSSRLRRIFAVGLGLRQAVKLMRVVLFCCSCCSRCFAIGLPHRTAN